ncbi:MAG: L-threonylcarbamoyladenylate synthase [Proteobacteria bacterium]|nr:L-threonylcarbamoyladenylate synthase [Pseudomonadota bacterium]
MSAADPIGLACALLRSGQLVAMPTETVYGLAANARDDAAVARIYALKGRPVGHPLIVHLADVAQVPAWAAEVPAVALRLAARFWPGPLTLILRRAAGVSDGVTGGQDTVGLRVPSHPVAQRLLRAFGDGIAAPSANRYGRVSPTTAAHVREEFGAQTPFLLEGGDCEVGLESTIVSLAGEPLLLRPGGIPQADLEQITGPLRRAAPGEGPRAPGTTVAHYAPATTLSLIATAALTAGLPTEVAVLARGPAPAGFGGRLWLDAGTDPQRYAHDLYANLRQLDRAGAGSILVESVPDTAAWDAIRDRLARAAAACAAEDLA